MTRDEFEIQVGRPEVHESAVGAHGVVFEDDGDTGYVYAVESVARKLRAPKVRLLDAFHVYDTARVRDADRPHAAAIEWTADGAAAAFVLDGWVHVMVDFSAGQAMSVGEFPPPTPDGPFPTKAWDETAFVARFPHLSSEWESRRRSPETPSAADDDTDVPDDDHGVDPPDPDRVARRAAILAAVTIRGFIEGDDDLDDPQTVLREDLAFVSDLGLTSDMEPEEAALVSAPYGSLPDQDRINAIWRTEGLGVLTWALGLVDRPPPIDATFSPQELGPILRLPWAGGDDVTLVRSPHLRPAADLQHLEQVLHTAHWRVREFQLRPEPIDLVQVARDAWWGPLELSDLELADGDLAIGGEPIATADRDLVQMVSSILTERRLAISWLTGYDALYSEGDTNT